MVSASLYLSVRSVASLSVERLESWPIRKRGIMSNSIATTPRRITPSKVEPGSRAPFTLDQELKPFGRWVGKRIWVPPKESSEALAQSMLERRDRGQSIEALWKTVEKKHRNEFTQVREIELPQASIRLPQGRFFVTVTEQQHFDQITDTVPACVQTRLDEFLAGPGRQPGVRVYYLKPLCVEDDGKLLLTPKEDLTAAIEQIKQEAVAEYRRLLRKGLPRRIAAATVNLLLAVPRSIVDFYVQRKQRAIDAFEAKLEFQRRRTALRAAKTHRKCFTTGCTYDEMLALTSDFDREEVIDQYVEQHSLSRAERDRLIRLAAGTLPWFATLSLATTYALSVTFVSASPVMVVDPAFVAEMPDDPGVLLKIGHFDEVDGVTHVEILTEMGRHVVASATRVRTS